MIFRFFFSTKLRAQIAQRKDFDDLQLAQFSFFQILQFVLEGYALRFAGRKPRVTRQQDIMKGVVMFFSIIIDWFTRLFYPKKTNKPVVSQATAPAEIEKIITTRKKFSVTLGTTQQTRERVEGELAHIVNMNNIFTDTPRQGTVCVVVATPRLLGFQGEDGSRYSFDALLKRGVECGLTNLHESTQEACMADTTFVRNHGGRIFFARFGKEGEVSYVIYSNGKCVISKIVPTESGICTVGLHAKIVFELRT